jgi:hypothetical protein
MAMGVRRDARFHAQAGFVSRRLHFLHQLTAHLPCRAPAPLRIAFVGL